MDGPPPPASPDRRGAEPTPQNAPLRRYATTTPSPPRRPAARPAVGPAAQCSEKKAKWATGLSVGTFFFFAARPPSPQTLHGKNLTLFLLGLTGVLGVPSFARTGVPFFLMGRGAILCRIPDEMGNIFVFFIRQREIVDGGMRVFVAQNLGNQVNDSVFVIPTSHVH